MVWLLVLGMVVAKHWESDAQDITTSGMVCMLFLQDLHTLRMGSPTVTAHAQFCKVNEGCFCFKILKSCTVWHVIALIQQAVTIAPAASGLQRVAKAVMSARLDGDFVMLPPDLPLKIPPPLRTSIFARSDYHKVIKRLCIKDGGMKCIQDEDDALHLQSPEAGSGNQATRGMAPPPRSSEQRLHQSGRMFVGTVLTGPPGTGKSSILPLVLVHLAQTNNIVVYR